ncbi:hypothetical protein [Varunaivibrio sulfuroxidans]|uniref:Uncharacterized protein n=1 Tax=Varunaivibrio sulfuroxidans TaxID=1773489 RepID=A0A4R3JH79_9PROT|nr:hypothetical protein [Varunaivibrio sulfuroxidans]TCS64683.1 hypothetical protein EDD55_1018 [Varunaivibrio sulfuroxidans]WES30010.1 hypothetical protein P3M64_10225 [Varunaivibrio sulfuroxidans]
MSKPSSTKGSGGIKIIKGGGKHLLEQVDISKKKTKKKTQKKKTGSKGSKKGRPATHGLSGTPTYGSRRNAQQRCENPNHPQYKDYGGRGIECRITVMDLVEDIGLCPEGMTLDRIDPNGHYEKGNIQWATPLEQANNRRPARSSEQYKEQALRDIRATAQSWKDNTRWWNLSLKLINHGALPEAERKELKTLNGGHRFPRTSFELDEPRDWAHHSAGKVRLPSLIHPGHEVRISCGPVGGMRDKTEIERGLLAGLAQVPLSGNSDKSHRAIIKRFVQNFEDRSMMGLCFSAQDFDPEHQTPSKLCPERLLLALASRLHLKKKWNVRFMPMSDLSEVLENGNADDLIGHCLFIPDFHVSGPRGFGIPPWQVDDLLDLLRERIDYNNPTVIYAEAPWKLSKQIDHFINDYYLRMSENA